MAKQMGHHKKNPNRDPHDFYPTDPKFVEALLRQEEFTGMILEPACGEGHISKVLINSLYTVASSDLVEYGYGWPDEDFLKREESIPNIVTNPPYKHGIEFVKHALKLANEKVAMLMKLNFAETQGRYQFFIENPPNKIILISNRMKDSQFPHAWMVWDNKNRVEHGETKFIWEMAK